jgi:hypothetical protein
MPANSKKRHQLEPISYDELLSNAGMSGFVSFLDPDIAPPPPVSAPLKPARSGRRSRIWKAKMVEDGHSLAEQAVYEALWNAADPLSEGRDGRTLRIGYHRLSQITRLSWVSVKANLRSLEKKLAIDVIASENSAAQEGKRYLVYSRPAILERRRRAGLEWVRRTRGVELLSRAALAISGDNSSGEAFQALTVGGPGIQPACRTETAEGVTSRASGSAPR